MTWKTNTVFIAVGAGLLLTGQLSAAPPTWEELRRTPLLMREHYIARSDTNSQHYNLTDGIWRFDPRTNTPRRARPFFANEQSSNPDLYFNGDQGFLTIKRDRVIFQAYPYDIHFGLLSWRMLNRFPAANGEASGWALQGPYLHDDEVMGTGLDRGVYGIARCVIDIMIDSRWGFEPCTPRTIPGSNVPRTTTEERILLWAPDSPGTIEEATPRFAFDDTSWDRDRVLLSFDPVRRGFWRGTELNVQFHPVTNGAVQPPTIDIDLNAIDFDLAPEGSFLFALHHHSPADKLYGILQAPPLSVTTRPALLFSLDPSTHDVEERLNDRFHAFTFASLGAQPGLHEQLIPIVADTLGHQGVHWQTYLWLYNPSDTTTTVTLRRLLSPDATHTVVLAGHGSVRIDDVLLVLGGGLTGDSTTHDALFVSSEYRWAEQITAHARIWTRDPATGGTFGHAVPAVPAPWGYSNHSTNPMDDLGTDPGFNIGANSLSAHIDLDLREPGRYRHTIGIINPAAEEVEIELAWTFRDGSQLLSPTDPDSDRRVTLSIPPHDLLVAGIESLFPDEVVEGWVPRIGVFSAEPAIVWYAMIDNQTHDATFIPYTLFFATPAFQVSEESPQSLVDYRLALPVVANTAGVTASAWQTDLYGYDHGHWNMPTPVAAFHPSQPGECTIDPVLGEAFRFLEGELAMPVDRWLQTTNAPPDDAWQVIDPLRTIFPDVVRHFPECSDATDVKGGLEILAGSWFSGFSRTYTTRADGGTYGGMLPLYPPGGWPIQHFAGLEASDNTRINIGFFNGDHEHQITSRVTLYDASGSQVAQRHVTLSPLASLQREISHFFHLSGLDPGSYGLTVLPIDDPAADVQGRSWAYVSVIDNTTNDPTNLW